jgi:hypothetical protein
MIAKPSSNLLILLYAAPVFNKLDELSQGVGGAAVDRSWRYPQVYGVLCFMWSGSNYSVIHELDVGQLDGVDESFRRHHMLRLRFSICHPL